MEIGIKQHISKQEIESEQGQISAAQKDPAKFEVLYNRYHEQLFRFVYKRLDSKEIAFDLTQQVFMKALAGIQKYRFKGLPFSAWLYRIATNELNSLFKKNSKLRTVNIETTHIEQLADEIEEETIDDLYKKLLPLIGALADDELNLIEMRYFENRAFREIGNILSITENNAKVKVYRIINKLKSKLKIE